MDEFEIEITPLDGSDHGDGPDWAWSGAAGARSPFASRLSRRGKLARMATACSAVFLVCALLMVLSPALRGAFGGLLHGSGPTDYAESIPGSEDVYFENGVPWGTLRLDGHAVTHPANQMLDHLMVTPGQHTLEYDDAPFTSLRCRFHVPSSTTDTCPLEFTPPASASGDGLYVRIINLSATPDRLPPDQLATLTDKVDMALRSLTTETVLPAGAMYLSADGKPVVSGQPLLATLSFSINTNPHVVAPYLPGGHLCSQICFLGDGIGDPQSWGLLALTSVSWEYSLLDGQVIASGAPASPAPDGSTALVTVGVTWAYGTWRAVALPSRDQFGVSPICDVATTLMPGTPPAGFLPTDYTQEQVPAPTSAEGCVITMQLNHAGSPGAAAYLLYRFGVLLAANDAARQLYPQLPAASTHDMALANAIVSNPPIS